MRQSEAVTRTWPAEPLITASNAALNAWVAALRLLPKSAVMISGGRSAAMATKVEHSFSL